MVEHDTTLYLVKIKPLKLRGDCPPFFLLTFKFAPSASFPWKLNRYSYGVQFGINFTALAKPLPGVLRATLDPKRERLIGPEAIRD